MLFRFVALAILCGALASGPASAQSLLEKRSADIKTFDGETFRLKEFLVVANGSVARSFTACWNGGTVRIRMPRIEQMEFSNRKRSNRCSFEGILAKIKLSGESDAQIFTLRDENFLVLGFGQFGRWHSDMRHIMKITFLE